MSSTTAPSGTVHDEWVNWVYAPGFLRADPLQAARALSQQPDLLAADPYLQLGAGIVDPAILATPDQPGGPLGMPPLVAVTFSSLIRLSEYAEPLLAAAQALLDAGGQCRQLLD